MFCRECGRENPDSNRFCNGCGVALEGSSDLKEAPVADEPAVEEEPVMAEPPVAEEPTVEAPAPAAVAEPVADVAQEVPAAPATKKRAGRKLAVAALALVALGLVAVLGYLLLGRLLGGKSSAYVYLTGENELMFLPDLKEKTKALEITDEAGQWSWADRVQLSPDGKSVYYLDTTNEDRYDLYRATLSQIKKGKGGDLIVEDVASFRVLDDQNVAFWRYDREDWSESLGLFDGKEDDIICRETPDILLSKDGKSVYYANADGTLYRRSLSSGKEEVLLEESAFILTDWDAGTLVYSVVEAPDDEEDPYGENYYTVYAKESGKEPRVLLEEVSQYFMNAAVDKSQLRLDYTTTQRWGNNLYDFVNDPGDLDAEELNPPDYIEYNIRDVYYLPDTGEWYYVDYMDEVWHPIDVTSLLAEGGDAARLDKNEVWTLAQVLLDEEYQGKYEAWENVRLRDELRQELKDSSYTVHTYDLYRYVDGASQLIAADVTNLMGGDGIYLYQKAASRDKVVDLADLDLLNYYDVIDETLRSGQWYQNVNGKESPIDIGEATEAIFDLFVLSDDEVAVVAYCDGVEYLKTYAVAGDRLQPTGTLAEGGIYIVGARETAQGVRSLYFISDFYGDEQGVTGTLTRYRAGEKTELVRRITDAWSSPDGESWWVEIAGETGGRQLARLDSGELTVVTDDLADYTDDAPFAVSGGKVLYIDREGVLRLWTDRGEKTRRLGKDVKALWPSGPEGYDWAW